MKKRGGMGLLPINFQRSIDDHEFEFPGHVKLLFEYWGVGDLIIAAVV